MLVEKALISVGQVLGRIWTGAGGEALDGGVTEVSQATTAGRDYVGGARDRVMEVCVMGDG